MNMKHFKYIEPLLRTKSNTTTCRRIHQSVSVIASSKPKLTSNEVRQSFQDYFIQEHQHEFYRSSPVKPSQHDQSLLFVNAGMNQFKPIFLDQTDQFEELKSLRRVCNSQKCIRVGGKHCDLETVGTDFTHHTFFEMLGNWSFNDYFKSEACQMAWTLLTKIYGIDPKRLFVTIFGGNQDLNLEPDLETYEIWRSLGIPKNRIITMGMKDNFWEMGKTGPCGICTEIHYILKEPDGDCQGLAEKDFLLANSVEIWNLVFIQYFRDSNEKLNRLGKNFVDTGMGLERILSLVQNVSNNYATDLFTPYFDRLYKLCKWPQYSHKLNDEKDVAYRILADHARMASVAIADGVEPDDRGAGYLLRRVIRRAIDSMKTLSKIQPLPIDVTELDVFFILADTTIRILGQAFPELQNESSKIFQTFEDEIRLYSTAIVRNSAVMKYSRLLSLEIQEDSQQNEEQILKKLGEIRFTLGEIEKRLMEQDFIIGQKELEQQRQSLHTIQELMTFDPTLTKRFGLSSDEIETRFNDVDLKLTELENRVNQSFEQLIQDIQTEFRRRLYDGKNLILLPVESLRFVDRIKNFELGFLMKTALDLYGQSPLALVIQNQETNSIIIQISVPSSFQKKLNAITWFDSIMEQMKQHNPHKSLKVVAMPTKRIKKIVKYRIECGDSKQSAETFESVIMISRRIGDKHFNDL